MTITELLYYGILFSGIVIGSLKFRGLKAPGKLLWLMMIYILVKELLASYLAAKIHNNLSYYQVLSPVDFCFTLLLLGSLPPMKNVHRYLWLIGLIVVAFFFLNVSIWQPPGKGADTNFKMFRSFFLVLLSLVLFARLNYRADDKSIFSKSIFWISTGLIVFYSFNIFYWGAYNYFLHHNPAILNGFLRSFFIAANYILYICFSIALLLNNFSDKNNSINPHASG
jgi:lysylphosphatidylglycerol synthetase-like protein (DUF2156 family)